MFIRDKYGFPKNSYMDGRILDCLDSRPSGISWSLVMRRITLYLLDSIYVGITK